MKTKQKAIRDKVQVMSWTGNAGDKVSPKKRLLRRSFTGAAVDTHQHIAGRNSST